MSQTGPPSRAERDRLAENDTRDGSKPVLTDPKNASQHGYAYHVIDDDGGPVCGAGGPEKTFRELSIEEAQRKNKAPCQMCERILDQRSSSSEA